MLKHEKFLLSFAFLSFGMVLGFILAPIKKGITVTCGNNNSLSPHKGPRRRGGAPGRFPKPVPVSDEIPEENL